MKLKAIGGKKAATSPLLNLALALAVVLALFVGACNTGNDDDDDGQDEGTSSPFSSIPAADALTSSNPDSNPDSNPSAQSNPDANANADASASANATIDEGERFKVLSYNAGLLPGFVLYPEERAPFVQQAIANTDADVICLQEVWSDADVAAIKDAAAERYPHSYSVRTEQITGV